MGEVCLVERFRSPGANGADGDSGIIRYRADMPLMLQAGAVIVAIALLAALLGGQKPATTNTATAAVAATIAITAILSGSLLWPTLSGFVRDTAADARISNAQAAAALGQSLGLRADFLDWVAARIPRGATFYLVGNAQSLEWFNYRLTPRRAVDSPANAEWIIFGGSDALSALGSAATGFGQEEKFAPGFAIAQRLSIAG